MRGLHGNIPCKPRAYHSHSSIVAVASKKKIHESIEFSLEVNID
jgi:hypothetical protein